jgi:hypothetical protein
MSEHTIRAIETRYRGYRFRSRLEARWAVALSAVKELPTWIYEPEGYRLPSGMYLPDFWIQETAYLEVKGASPTEHEAQLCHELSVHTGQPVYLVSGELGEHDVWRFGVPLRDTGRPDFQAQRSLWLLDWFVAGHCDCWEFSNPETDANARKYFDSWHASGRAARFEHGEEPR